MVSQALDLATAERDPQRAASAIVPMADMLPELTSVVLNAEGVRRAVHGRELGPAETERRLGIDAAGSRLVRLVDSSGQLVGIAVPAATPGLLHPSVVLM